MVDKDLKIIVLFWRRTKILTKLTDWGSYGFSNLQSTNLKQQPNSNNLLNRKMNGTRVMCGWGSWSIKEKNMLSKSKMHEKHKVRW